MPDLCPDKRLHNAVTFGHLREAERSIDDGASVNGVPELSRLPLNTATASGSVQMMKLLIDRGADIDAGSKDGPARLGRTAVHDAACKGRVKALEFLIGRGANVNAVDANGGTPLFAACASFESAATRVAVAKILLDAGADATYAYPKPTGSFGGTALLMSTVRNDLGMIDLLAARAPAALDLCYVDGLGPLALAAREGYEDAVTRLLKAGARYKPGSGKWYVPVEAAFSQCAEGWSRCPLEAAVGQGHAGVVRILLAQDFEVLGGANVVASSLRVAVDQGFAKIVRMLLDAQGESQREHWANSRFNGNPALALASCYGSLATVNVLLAAGADETAVCDVGGAIASDVIGLMPPGGERAGKKKSAAIFRSLERGPAYRARSWAWVANGEDTVTAGAAGAGAGAATTTVGKLSTLHSWGTAVRIFRPTRDTRLIKSIGRYVLKGHVASGAISLLGEAASGAALLHGGMKRGRVPIPGRTKVETCRHDSDAHLPASDRKLYYMRTEC